MLECLPKVMVSYTYVQYAISHLRPAGKLNLFSLSFEGEGERLACAPFPCKGKGLVSSA
jgi:hypothetical protein